MKAEEARSRYDKMMEDTSVIYGMIDSVVSIYPPKNFIDLDFQIPKSVISQLKEDGYNVVEHIYIKNNGCNMYRIEW